MKCTCPECGHEFKPQETQQKQGMMKALEESEKEPMSLLDESSMKDSVLKEIEDLLDQDTGAKIKIVVKKKGGLKE
jgi:hypothetical protein